MAAFMWKLGADRSLPKGAPVCPADRQDDETVRVRDRKTVVGAGRIIDHRFLRFTLGHCRGNEDPVTPNDG